jgi:LPXTG-motif cell wall-anchored protein
VFAVATVLCLTLGAPASTAAPAVQDGRFLAADSVDITYSCTGADQTTQDILNSFGLSPFPQQAVLTSVAVDPAPSPGEDFDVDFIYDFTLNETIVLFAIGLGVTGFTISDGVAPISATAGATGTAPGTDPEDHVLELGDGSVPVGYTAGPLTGTFNRTAAVDEPISFEPGTLTTGVVTSSGVALSITCDPGEGTLTMLDQTGVPPTTTTTTRPQVVTTTTVAGATTTTAGVGAAGELPRTGSSSNLLLALLGLALIDIGYLAWSASRPPRRRRASSLA